MPAPLLHDFLQPCSPYEIIHQLANHKEENPSQDIQLDLYTTSSTIISGLLVKLSESSQKGSYLILASDTRYEDHIFLPLDHIQAVKVYKTRLFKEAVTFNTFPEHLAQEQKTALQAKRAIASLESPITLQISWDSFPQDPFIPNAIFIFCQNLVGCFKEMAKDKLGKEAIKNIKELQVMLSSSSCTYFEKKKRLITYLDPKGKIPSKDELINLLNPYL